MRKEIACTLVALSILLVMSANTASTLAADYTKPGAVVGTNAYYDFAETGNPINAVRIQVIAVSGSVLILEITQYNPDGSVRYKFTDTIDVNAYQYSLWQFVAANISAGEALYPGSGWKFNSTVSNYHIAGRYWTANYINGTVEESPIYVRHFVAYVDKPTGILLMSRYHDSYGLTVNYTLSSYAVEPVGIPLTLVLIAGGAVAALLVIVAALMRMRRKKQ
ncbi:MAG: hypothetical protein WED04_12275 [Promethearchaeati archaeon SRVP18_Atabeyarchaeia-1]